MREDCPLGAVCLVMSKILHPKAKKQAKKRPLRYKMVKIADDPCVHSLQCSPEGQFGATETHLAYSLLWVSPKD